MRWIFRVAIVAAVLAIVTSLLLLYRRHRADIVGQQNRAAPVTAPSRVVAGAGEAVVALREGDAERLDLKLAALRPVSASPEVRLAGELVPEPERVAAVRAPLAGRLGLPDGAHWPSFGEAVAAGAVVAQVSDAKPLTAPRGGVVTQTGAQPGEMVQAGQLLLEITDYSEPLARVAWAAEAPAPPATLLLSPAGAGRSVRARLIGAAPSADPITRLPAYLYRAEHGWAGARPGAAVVALVARGGVARRGVLVPDRALVQWEGLTWAYVRRGPGRFRRVRVPTDQPIAGGVLAGPGLQAGDTVVVQGAEQLLSEEFRARVTVGDEPGE